MTREVIEVIVRQFVVFCHITHFFKNDEFKDQIDGSVVKRAHAVLPEDQSSIFSTISSGSQLLVTSAPEPMPLVPVGICIHCTYPYGHKK